MEFLQLFPRRHFMGKPVLAWQNVSCFLRPPVTSQNIASILLCDYCETKIKKKRLKKKKQLTDFFFLFLIKNKNVVKTGESWGCLAYLPHILSNYI